MPYKVTAKPGLFQRGVLSLSEGDVVDDEFYDRHAKENGWVDGLEKISKTAAKANGNGKSEDDK